MFRLYRKTVYHRWHCNYKNSFGKKSQDVKPKVLVLCTNSDNHGHSNDSHKKQHANKQEQRYWDDPYFHFNFYKTSLFETAGWLGTVAVCFSYHFRYISNVIEYENGRSTCLFSNIVRALPRRQIKSESTKSTVSLQRPQAENEIPHSSTISLPTLHSLSTDIGTHLVVPDSISEETVLYRSEKNEVLQDAGILGESIKSLGEKYSVAIENLNGVRNINKDDKKAFRFFQNAARHGSTAGFYNLGLCYQLGKGTRVNLNMAAYCYKRAVIKGHGLAAFNLAVFFQKGIGGLPVDTKLAKELLAEAAEKGVPEAQLYFGILYFEEGKWTDAVRIFSNLVKKNIPDAQYYLGLCYEKGLGVQRNVKSALELFKNSAEQGNKRAVDKLKNSNGEYSNNSHSSSKTEDYKIKKSCNLHSSMSVPELSTVFKKSNQTLLKFPILSYLDLFTPLLIGNNTTKVKDSFCSSKKLDTEYSSTYVSLRPLPALVMEVKSQ